MKIVMELGRDAKHGFNGMGHPTSQKFHGPFLSDQSATEFVEKENRLYPVEVRKKPRFSVWDLNQIGPVQ